MVDKFISVKNIGRFRSYSAKGDVSFRKLTLVYGENGTGKSTLAAILRSLKDADPVHVLERETVDGVGKPEVQLLVSSNKIAFQGGEWNKEHPHLEVFDASFIDQNVFSGHSVELGHRRNLYKFAVGKEGVEYAKEVIKIDEENRELNRTINRLKSQILKHASAGVDVDEFVSLPKIEALDELLSERKNELETVKREEKVARKNQFSKVSLPEIPLGPVRKVLENCIEDVSKNVEEKVRSHIDEKLGSNGEGWISQGLGYMEDEECPFCGGDLSGNGLVRLYREYFNEAYRRQKRDTQQIRDRVAELLSDRERGSLSEIVGRNTELQDFWDKFIDDCSLPEFDMEEIREAWYNYRLELLRMLDRKVANVLEPIPVRNTLKNAHQAYEEQSAKLEGYNREVDRLNTLINDRKERAKAASRADLAREVARLENIKSRYTEEAKNLCEEYLSAKKRKEKLAEKKSQAKEELDTYTVNLFSQYQQSINQHLEAFGARFKVVDTRRQYTGGKPSSKYKIEINGRTIDPFSTNQSVEPSFGTCLSEGDKSSLAFALFLSRLEQDTNLNEKTVVFDDPITSLGKQRKNRTQHEILRIVGRAKQVIVLSHDPFFLRLMRDNYKKGDIQLLRIVRRGKTNIIEGWDIERDTQGEYFNNYHDLANYLKEGPRGDLRHIARCIRPLLEGNLRLRFPERFRADMWLGEFISEIRKAEEEDSLATMQEHLSELEAINNYSKRYHHDQNPNAHAEHISDAELRSYVEKTLELIPGIYSR